MEGPSISITDTQFLISNIVASFELAELPNNIGQYNTGKITLKSTEIFHLTLLLPQTKLSGHMTHILTTKQHFSHSMVYIKGQYKALSARFARIVFKLKISLNYAL